MQAAGPEISEARALYQPPFVLAATRRVTELAAHFAELQIPIDTAAKVLDCSLEAQALRQMTTGWDPGGTRHLLWYTLDQAGGPRSAGQGHPYALLFNQVRLMEDSGSIATASRVERIVGSAETFQIAWEVSKVLFDLSPFASS